MRSHPNPLFKAILALLLLVVSAHSQALQDRSVTFNISTSKTFAPGEQPKIHLYTHNVDALEFRIYRVNDSVKFIENLRELHSFGPEAGLLAKEQIDERTPLEKFHDWKSDWAENIKDFFRLQFSHAARMTLRDKQSSISRRSRIVNEAEFAQIPILNQNQLVSRWRQLVPATYLTDTNNLAVPKLGPGLYLLEATDGRYKAYTLVMVSQMVLVTRTSAGSVMTYVVDRTTGAPIPGAKVDAGFGQTLVGSATTDSGGVAQIPMPDEKSAPDNFWVVAGKGDQFAAATPGGWSLSQSRSSKFVGYVFTERPIYRPTHTVHWKAILRAVDGNALALPKPQNVHIAITEEGDKKLYERDLPLSPTGEVTGDFDLPKDAPLGYYYIRVGNTDEDTISGSFHVEDYRKPEYRVQIKPSQKRVLQGATTAVTIDSQYFFGEPVVNAPVKYRIYQMRHYWWGDSEDDDQPPASDEDNSSNSDNYFGDEEQEKTGKLDANGQLVIQVPTHVDKQGDVHTDLDYSIEAGVTDAANREISGHNRFLATYGTFRLNVEPVTYAVRSGENAKFHVTALDYDEKPVSTRVHVQLRFHHYADGKTETTLGPTVDVTTDAKGNGVGEIPVGAPQYSSAELFATADAVQPKTNNPEAESYLWIMGAREVDWESSTETTQIVADKKSYAPGDIAHLSIVSQTSGFYALVVAQGYAVQKREVMHTDGNTLSFDLAITTESQPNITVDALFLKDNTLYQATKVLKVPPKQQQLQVEITPAKDMFQPQQTASYDVLTRDYTGKPVPAELSFGVVDEAIYALESDSSGDMVKELYPQRYVESQVDSSLDYYFSGEAGNKSPLLAMRNARYRPQLAQVKPGNEAKPRVRKAFPDTAFWAPNVHTDATGHAHVTLTFPDSLTTWRATVHAITTDSKAGSAISRVLVRKNVLVRMGTPRFMLKGDEITLPVIVHNYLETAKQATVSLKIDGLDVVAGSQQSVSVPSKGEATVLWRLRASHVGTAKLTAAALTDEESDALELTFPIQAAGVAKSLSQSGVLNQTAQQAAATVNFPAGTDPAAHSLHVEVSSSIAGSLFPALGYLTSYPYGCTEQTMSSYLPNVIVAETLSRLNVSGHIDQADLQAKMAAGIARLKDYQHEDGGWGWWKEDDSRVFMTAYVVSGLGMGSKLGSREVNTFSMILRGKEYLQKALNDHPNMRPELRAAVLYALSQAGDKDIKTGLDAEFSRRNDLEPEALAMTGLAMIETGDTRAGEIAKVLSAKAVHQGELVFWNGSYVPLLDASYENDSEATAYAVRLLSKLNPGDPLLAPAAQWLMLQRTDGIWWDSTEQTAMVLFGLTDYLAASHELDSDFTVDVEVNGHSIGQHHFTADDARNGATLSLDVDAAHLQPGNNSVHVTRQSGSGRIYWSVRGRYFSTDKKNYQAGTMSLNLTRDYYKLVPIHKDNKIVYSLETLGSTAQVGDVLAVHETIAGSSMRYLLLEDPIPAGAEFIQNESSYPLEKRPGGWYDWFTRREFHDDHAAFFSSDFSGHQEIFYLIRIVNPGTFQVSPAHVEPMYQPGVDASSDAFQLQVPAPPPVTAPAQGGPQ